MSLSEKHTPGPWFYDGINYIFAYPNDPQMVGEVRGTGWDAPQDANGKLMASSPELLSALKMALSDHLSDCDCKPCMILEKVELLK